MPAPHPAAVAPLAAPPAAAVRPPATAGPPSAARSAPAFMGFASAQWASRAIRVLRLLIAIRDQTAVFAAIIVRVSTLREQEDGTAGMCSELSSPGTSRALAAPPRTWRPPPPQPSSQHPQRQQPPEQRRGGIPAEARLIGPTRRGENRRPRWPTGSKLASRGVLAATLGPGMRVGRRSLPASTSRYASRA